MFIFIFYYSHFIPDGQLNSCNNLYLPMTRLYVCLSKYELTKEEIHFIDSVPSL